MITADTDTSADVFPSHASLEWLMERIESAYKAAISIKDCWHAVGIVEGRTCALRLVVAMSDATPKTPQNLTRLETLYEVMCRLQEHKEP